MFTSVVEKNHAEMLQPENSLVTEEKGRRKTGERGQCLEYSLL
jgi:hypothetical protein